MIYKTRVWCLVKQHITYGTDSGQIDGRLPTVERQLAKDSAGSPLRFLDKSTAVDYQNAFNLLDFNIEEFELQVIEAKEGESYGGWAE